MPSPRHQTPLSLIFSDFQTALRPRIKNAQAVSQMAQRIETWTGTTAELASIVCLEIIQNSSSVDTTQPEASVDRIIKENILAYWESSLAAQHLGAIADTLLQPENKDLRLLSYLEILQRGSVPKTDSPEHQDLLACGLALVEGSTLKVANTIYTKVFDTHWIEEQIPGITRPVTMKTAAKSSGFAINTPSASDSKQPSKASGLYSKLAVITCCLAVLGAMMAAYRSEPGNESIATQATRQTMASLKAKADPVPADTGSPLTNQPSLSTETTSSSQVSEQTASQVSKQTTLAATANAIVTAEPITNRVLFDQGIEHATNSRWLPMVRAFCQLTPNATYTTLAERQLENWVKLYREDIEIAQTTFTQEEGSECVIVSKSLSAAPSKSTEPD